VNNLKKEDIKPDTVYYTTNYEVLEEVVRKTDEVKNNDLLKSEFIARLGRYITNKSGLVLVSFGEDKKLNSCMVISRHIDGLGQYAWIDFVWCDKHYPYLKRKYRDEITNLCKLYGVKRVQGRTSRDLKVIQRLDKEWHEIAIIVEKEII